MTLAQYLKQRGKEICRDNKCKEEEHYCESYAYINANMQLLDICVSDFFGGTSKPHAAIALPWEGNQKELEEEVIEQCYEDLREQGKRDYSPMGLISECPYSGRAAKYWKEGWREAKGEKQLS
jgi:hypothetical protein